MKKFIRIGGLLIFWVSTFALVTTLLRWQQRLDFRRRVDEESTASLGSSGIPRAMSGSATGDGGDTSPGSGAPDEGRRLFEVPKPIDYEEFSHLISELRSRKAEYDQKLAALDERDRRLSILEEEINQRQSELLRRARETPPAAGRSSMKNPGEDFQVDPEGVAKLAELFGEMKEDEAVANALLAMPTEKAVMILTQMKKTKSAAVLRYFPEDALERTIDAMMRKKDPAPSR